MARSRIVLRQINQYERCLKKLYKLQVHKKHMEFQIFWSTLQKKKIFRERWELLPTVCALLKSLNFAKHLNFLARKFLNTYQLLLGVRSMRTFYGLSRKHQLKCENSCQWAFNRLIMHRAFTCWKYINNSSIIRIDGSALRPRWFIGNAFYNAYGIFVRSQARVSHLCESYWIFTTRRERREVEIINLFVLPENNNIRNDDGIKKTIVKKRCYNH